VLAGIINENLVNINVSSCLLVLCAHSHVELVILVFGQPAVFTEKREASLNFDNNSIIFVQINNSGPIVFGLAVNWNNLAGGE